MLAGSGTQRTFLFLQGLSTPFFVRLAGAIAARGHRIERINLSGGDRVFWPRLGAVDYRGRFPDWRSFLGAFLHERGVSDVILFGDCRPYHRVAVDLARSRGIAGACVRGRLFPPRLDHAGARRHERPFAAAAGAGEPIWRKRRAIPRTRGAAAGERRHLAAGALGDPEPDRHDAAGAALSALPPPSLAPSA